MFAFDRQWRGETHGEASRTLQGRSPDRRRQACRLTASPEGGGWTTRIRSSIPISSCARAHRCEGLARVEFRTGIRRDPSAKDPVYLSMLVGLGVRPREVRSLEADLAGGRSRHSARLFQADRIGIQAPVRDGPDRARSRQSGVDLQRRRQDAASAARHHSRSKKSLVDHLELAVSHQPCLEESLQHIGLPIDRTFKGKVLKGKGVIVGVIDDGCAFAHRHFLRTRRGAGGGRGSSRFGTSRRIRRPRTRARGGRFQRISNTAASCERRRSTRSSMRTCPPARRSPRTRCTSIFAMRQARLTICRRTARTSWTSRRATASR